MNAPPAPSYGAPVAPSVLPGRRRTRWRRVCIGISLTVTLFRVVGSPLDWVRDESKDYTFFGDQDVSSTPITWDNCRAIHYVVNPQAAPPDWRQLVDAGLDVITAASGYVFVYDGTTTNHDFAAGHYEGDPVLVGWGYRREIGELGERAAGLAAPFTFDTPTGPRYDSGIVLLDAMYFDQLQRQGHRADMQMIVEHEFMHVLGLGHADDDSQVMSAGGHYGHGTALGEGDLAGLARLHSVPCPGAG